MRLSSALTYNKALLPQIFHTEGFPARNCL
jgi:hypothetical protein